MRHAKFLPILLAAGALAGCAGLPRIALPRAAPPPAPVSVAKPEPAKPLDGACAYGAHWVQGLGARVEGEPQPLSGLRLYGCMYRFDAKPLAAFSVLDAKKLPPGGGDRALTDLETTLSGLRAETAPAPEFGPGARLGRGKTQTFLIFKPDGKLVLITVFRPNAEIEAQTLARDLDRRL